MTVDTNHFFRRALACYVPNVNDIDRDRSKYDWERVMLETVDEFEEPGRTLLHILIWAGVMIHGGDTVFIELPNDEDHVVFKMLDLWEEGGFEPIEDGPTFVEQAGDVFDADQCSALEQAGINESMEGDT